VERIERYHEKRLLSHMRVYREYEKRPGNLHRGRGRNHKKRLRDWGTTRREKGGTMRKDWGTKTKERRNNEKK
jgi:hypothetical protein